MFPARTYLFNAYLACFDLTLAAVCYFGVVIEEGLRAKGTLAWAEVTAPARVVGLGWVLAVWFVLLAYFGMYHSRRLASAFSDLRVVVKVALAGLVVLEGLARLIPALESDPYFLVTLVVANFLCLSLARFAVRLILHEARRRGHNLKTLLLVTSPGLGDRLTKKINQRAHYGYHLLPNIFYVAGRAKADERVWQEFQDSLQSTRIDDVVLALPSEANRLVARLVEECEGRGINVRLIPDLFPIIQVDTQVYDLDGIPLVNVRLYPAEFFGYIVLKRIFDIAVSMAVLLTLSPVYLLIALLVKMTSRGPIFFVQERMGMNGRKFKMLKFRTMYLRPTRDPDTHWTRSSDPNVTHLGRWLRRSNLDELPQFLNVLKGEMSVVGPRPERPFFIERFRQEIPEYMVRHYVKSGITGWAQVNGWRGDTSIKDRLAHDLYYMRNWALTLDIKILLLTVTKTFFHRNAY